jgi:release factor glutamine methyltransferase
MITVLEAIRLSTDYLDKKGVESSRTNAEILLAEILKCKRLELYLSFDKPLADTELNLYREFIKKRGLRVPLQYIVGNVDFYGINLAVNEHVLIPRPETELLVEKIINDVKNSNLLKILDIGSGSGNIAITLSHHIKNSEVTAIDISEKALQVAKVNAEKNPTQNKINFKLFDILNDDLKLLGLFDIIVSNPPYVSASDYQSLEPELKNNEPKESLTDNSDGLSFYRHIISISRSILKTGGKLYFEIGKDQSLYVKEFMLTEKFKNVSIIKDYAGIDRIICGEME